MSFIKKAPAGNHSRLQRPNPIGGCPLTAALAAMGGKWKLIIIYWLAESPKHFAALRRVMSGISQKVLTQQLRELVSHGIVHRQPKGAIPAPVEVDELMRRVPKGKVVTINELRSALAKKHGVNIACPITTGIFSWIAAHAAQEAATAGAKRITPYWRTLKSGGEVNPKYPGGVTALKRKLQSEGHKIVARGKRLLVVDFEQHLVKWK